jgi:FG-GAP repeat
MRTNVLPGSLGFLATRRLVALVTVAGIGLAGALPGTASASVAPSARLRAELSGSPGGGGVGGSVAISGATAVVGAPGTNVGGVVGAGAVYVFARSGTGVSATWTQQAELTAPDGARFDGFGQAVAISGSTVVVGAPEHNTGIGAVYVFARSAGTWSQQAELVGSDSTFGAYFGSSVAISGSTAVVGAVDIGGNGTPAGPGAAYVFVRSGPYWAQHAELTASSVTGINFFGASVAISGATVLVGATGVYGDPGSAYVYVRSGTAWLGTWSQQAELTAGDGAANDQFGQPVAISGSTALVGAFEHDSSTGAAYVFTQSGTAWPQQAELTGGDGAANDEFGWSVALSGSTAVVGAYGHNSSTGAAYVFKQSGTAWPQQAELTAGDGAAGDEFGYWAGTATATALAGAPAHNSNAGAAYVFGNV